MKKTTLKTIKQATLKTIKQAVRDGYAWPGGYRLNIVMSDGALLCTQCARKNYRQIARDTVTDSRSGWAAVGVEIHWEGEPEYCSHCDTILPSEYGEVTV